MKSTNPTRENLSGAEETISLLLGAGTSGPVLSHSKRPWRERPFQQQSGWVDPSDFQPQQQGPLAALRQLREVPIALTKLSPGKFQEQPGPQKGEGCPP